MQDCILWRQPAAKPWRYISSLAQCSEDLGGISMAISLPLAQPHTPTAGKTDFFRTFQHTGRPGVRVLMSIHNDHSWRSETGHIPRASFDVTSANCRGPHAHPAILPRSSPSRSASQHSLLLRTRQHQNQSSVRQDAFHQSAQP